MLYMHRCLVSVDCHIESGVRLTTNDGELRTAENRVGLEIRHLGVFYPPHQETVCCCSSNLTAKEQHLIISDLSSTKMAMTSARAASYLSDDPIDRDGKLRKTTTTTITTITPEWIRRFSLFLVV